MHSFEKGVCRFASGSAGANTAFAFFACNDWTCVTRLHISALLLQGSVLQCGFILLSAILFWAFRSGESSSGGYGYITH